MAIDVSPLNDLALTVRLKEIDADTGAAVPFTDGTVTAFFAEDNDPATTAVDPDLSVSATHVGGGKWLAQFDGADLTTTLLDPLFDDNDAPVIVFQSSGNFRTYVELTYVRSRAAEEA